VKNGEADLFTVVVDDGKSLIELAKTEGYRDFLYADIRLEHQLASGVCSACQEKTDVVPDPDFPRGSLLKMYITDQPGFISNIPSDNAKKTKALLKNFPLCPNCLTHLLIGHQFIITTSSLSSSIYENKLKAFVIPYSRIRAKRIKEWLSLYEARWAFEAVTKIERDLEEWDEQNYYITIIFGSGEQANFRFYGAIREVPLTRLSLYEREIRQLKSELANCIALEQIESFPKLDMGSLGNLIPLRTAVNRVVEIEPLFSFFKAILKGEPIPPNVIASTCLTYAKIILYEKMRGYTVKPGKSRKVGFCTGVIAYKLLDTVIRRMNADMQRIEIPELRELPGHIKEIMNTLGLVEWQRPLFLLGYVMGEIGARQIAERAEKGEFPPIIRKISFDGMNRERVVRLSVEVSEAMKNYGVTGGDALLAWSYAQLGIQENIVRLNDPVLNVFHILSGYAYATLLHIGRKKEQAEEVKSDER
ncbi:MAG: TM1802 family CRISPR-associated protein, partial [Deltaproteobacteria bacterium]|nr:TM1802 family CRISPR-associated protein [Deltaproteobacteria bacterium]